MPDKMLDNIKKCGTLVFLSGEVPSPSGEAPRQLKKQNKVPNGFLVGGRFLSLYCHGETFDL
jgi:hypothetical protein